MRTLSALCALLLLLCLVVGLERGGPKGTAPIRVSDPRIGASQVSTHDLSASPVEDVQRIPPSPDAHPGAHGTARPVGSQAAGRDSFASIDAELAQFVSSLDQYAVSGGDMEGALIALEERASRLRRLSSDELVSMLDSAHDPMTMALLLLVLGCVVPEQAPDVLPRYTTHESLIVRIASLYGLAIESIPDGARRTDRKDFWTEMLGSMLLLNGSAIEHQAECVDHCRAIEDARILDLMVAAMTRNPDPMIRNFLAAVLEASMGEPAVARGYLDVLRLDDSSATRRTAARALTLASGDAARHALQDAIQTDSDADVRQEAIAALAQHDHGGEVAFLIDWFPHAQTVGEQRAIVTGIEHAPSAQITGFLASVVSGESETAVRADAIRVLASTKSHDAVVALIHVLSSPDAFLRVVAATQLGRMGDEEAVSHLRRASQTDVSDAVRRAASSSLTKLKK